MMLHLEHRELTSQIIDCAHAVHNQLGYGFLEKIYHNSFLIELTKRKLNAQSQKNITVEYDGHIVGEFFADIVVENKVLIEIKSAEKLNSIFEAQILNYLKASRIKVGLLINFGPSVQVKRMVF